MDEKPREIRECPSPFGGTASTLVRPYRCKQLNRELLAVEYDDTTGPFIIDIAIPDDCPLDFI